MIIVLINSEYIRFYKLHTIGNDFIFFCDLNEIEENSLLSNIPKICNRKLGIGADSVILLNNKCDKYSMRVLNSDGSNAEICGNALLCSFELLRKEFQFKDRKLKLKTDSGIKEVVLEDELYRANLGVAKINTKHFKVNDLDKLTNKLRNISYIDNIYFTSLGNPHVVIVINDQQSLSEIDFENLQREINSHDSIICETNIELIQKKNITEYIARVWERGCGETLSCGSGAAAIYHSVANYNAKEELIIKYSGGNIIVGSKMNREIYLKNKVNYIYKGILQGV